MLWMVSITRGRDSPPAWYTSLLMEHTMRKLSGSGVAQCQMSGCHACHHSLKEMCLTAFYYHAIRGNKRMQFK